MREVPGGRRQAVPNLLGTAPRKGPTPRRSRGGTPKKEIKCVGYIIGYETVGD